MKRWTVRSIAFFIALVLGSAAVYIFFPRSPQIKLHQVLKQPESNPDRLATSNDRFVPEFTEVELDEEVSKVTMDMEFVKKGNVFLCTVDPSKEKKKWLGLFRHKNSFVLEKRSVVFGHVEPTKIGSFARMIFPASRSAILMLTDDGTLKPGPVKTVYLKPDISDNGMEPYSDGMHIGDHRDFSLRDVDYRLRIAPAKLKNNQEVAVIVLEKWNQSQIVYYKSTDLTDVPGELEWVGDMDGDNKMDLLFSSYAQNGGQLESFLFLSSFASKNNLVGFAGFFTAQCRAFVKN